MNIKRRYLRYVRFRIRSLIEDEVKDDKTVTLAKNILTVEYDCDYT